MNLETKIAAFKHSYHLRERGEKYFKRREKSIKLDESWLEVNGSRMDKNSFNSLTYYRQKYLHRNDSFTWPKEGMIMM